MPWLKKCQDKWEANFLKCELLGSLFILFIILLFIDIFSLEPKILSVLNGIRTQLYGTIAAVFGALLGFVIAGLSILLSMGENAPIKILKESPHYKTIFEVFMDTSKYLAMATLASLFGLLIDKDNYPCMIFTYFILWITIISIFRLGRCLWVLERMVELKLKE